MKASDMIELLRYYRHDLMNQLQMIHGYLTIGHLDKVSEKVHETIEMYEEERKLMNVQAPEFIVWLLSRKYMDDRIDFTYTIDDAKINLANIEKVVIEDGGKIWNIIKKEFDPLSVVNLHLHISTGDDFTVYLFTYSIKTVIKDVNHLKDRIANVSKHVSFLQTEKHLNFQIWYPIDER